MRQRLEEGKLFDMSPQLLDEAKIDSGLFLLPLPPQESRHRGGDSTWVGGAPCPHCSPAWNLPSR